MKKVAILVLLASMPAWAPRARADKQSDVRNAWDALFANPNRAASPEQISAVLQAVSNDAGKLRKLIAADVAYEDQRPGWQSHKTRVTDGKTAYDVTFHVRIPKGYTPQKPWPLLLAMHGYSGNGPSIGRFMERRLGGQLEKYIIVAPTMPGKDKWNGKPYQEQVHLVPLAWARRALNVDDDRIAISGISQGGHGAWHLVVMFPYLFSAAVPMAGMPAFDGPLSMATSYLENQQHVDVWAVWGAHDRSAPGKLGVVDFNRMVAARLKKLSNRRFKGTELSGVGHGSIPLPAEFAAWLDPAKHKRTVLPEQFTHMFHLAHHGRGYYLEAPGTTFNAAELKKPFRIRSPVPRKLTRDEFVKAVQARNRRTRLWFRADLDRSKNALTVKARGIRRLRLYVMDGMFDLSRPVIIRYWHGTWRGKIPVSPKCMLMHYAATRDQTALVVNELDLPFGKRAAVRYP